MDRNVFAVLVIGIILFAIAIGFLGFQVIPKQDAIGYEGASVTSKVLQYQTGGTGCTGGMYNTICENGFSELCGPGPDGMQNTGDDVCENWETCCYDCGCSGLGQDYYCDFVSGVIWQCRGKPDSDDLSVSNQGPLTFSEHFSDGNEVVFDYTITDFPNEPGAEVINEGCSAECTPSDGGSCYAECIFLGCSNTDHQPGESFTRSGCSIQITIQNHNRGIEYTVTPTLQASVKLFEPAIVTIPLEKEMQPIGFSTFYCGNGVVGSGETPETCCIDTGCALNEYCSGTFPENSCKPISSITLTLSDNGPVGPFDLCSREQVFIVNVQLNNPPPGLELLEVSYDLGIGDSSVTECTVFQNTQDYIEYACPVTIPVQEETCGGAYGTITDNTLSFDINFVSEDGSEEGLTVNKQLSVSLPNILVDVFQVEDSICQDNLGEGSENSCHDCGCTDLGDEFFCDGTSGNYECRRNNFILSAGGVSPLNFQTHDVTNGDTVTFSYSISNFPTQSGVTITNEQLSADCRVRNPSQGSALGSCSARIEIVEGSCSDIIERDKFTRECTARIFIDDYTNDPTLVHLLEPVLSVDVVYNDMWINGGELSDALSDNMQNINFGFDYCGDGEADPGENSDNCCYDIGCEGSLICDSEMRTGPTNGDSCRSLSSVAMIIDELDTSGFGPNGQENTAIIEGHINNAPRRSDSLLFQYLLDFDLLACSFEDKNGEEYACGQIGMEIADCQDTSTNVDIQNSIYRFECSLDVPAIPNFRESDFYYEDEGKIKFLNGDFEIMEIGYFNASSSGTIRRSASMGDMEIDVEIVCGDGICDTYYEIEGDRACPADCGCNIDIEILDNNNCVPLSDTFLEIVHLQDTVRQEEGKAYCVINVEGESCEPAGELKVTVRVNNAFDGLEINVGSDDYHDNVQASIDDGDVMWIGANCRAEDPSIMEYTCRLAQLEDDARFDDAALDQVVPKTLEIIFTGSYTTIDRNTHQETYREITLPDLVDFDYVELEREDITFEKNCRDRGGDIQQQIDSLQRERDSLQMQEQLLTIAAIFVGWQMGGIMQAMSILPMLTGPMQNSMSEIQAQITGLQSAYASICHASSLQEQLNAMSSVDQTLAMYGAISGGSSDMFNAFGLLSGFGF